MVSGVEVPSWVGRDLRVGCVVVCGRERERGGEEGREEVDYSLFLLKLLETPWSIPMGSPAGPPTGASPELSHIHHSPTYPSYTDPKVGDPHPPPHRGKGRKKGGKRGLWKLTNLNFSLWGRTPRPPHSTGTRKKKTRKAGARVMLTGRTKSIDLIETSSTAVSVSP